MVSPDVSTPAVCDRGYAMAAADRGYAMVAAVAAMGLFAVLALDGIAIGRGAVVGASATIEHARLAAAADAGTAIAVHGLGIVDASQRWQPEGEPRAIDFDGMTLTVTVEDETAKIPLNFVQSPRVRRLFELTGVPAAQRDGLVTAFLRLRGDPVPGATSGPVAQVFGLTAIDELTLLDGMTPAIYARIAPAVTVSGTTLAFDPQHAGPLALAVMTGGAAISQAIERQGPPIDRTTALSTADTRVYGHPLSVRVDVGNGANGHFSRTTVVELTGVTARPYIVRSVD